MPLWSQLGLQEGMGVSMELMIYFHDYMMAMLCIIMGFVFYIFLVISSVSYLDKFIIESHFLELIWTLIPMIFLLFMAFPSLYILYLTEDVSSSGLTVKAVGHQWYWEYEFMGSFFSKSYDSYMQMTSPENLVVRNLDVDNRLALPWGISSNVFVTAVDVLHSWTVPSLGVKVDAVPGRLNFLSLTPTQSGVFYGQCSELCGTNHSFMPIVLEVLSSEGFVSFSTI